MMEYLASEQCSKFLKASEQIWQEHVVNFITKNGDHTCCNYM